jgi:hypothetical protein
MLGRSQRLLCWGLALGLVLGAGAGPLGAQGLGPERWARFEDCLAAVRRESAWPQRLVPSEPLAYPSRRPRMDAAGQPVPGAPGRPATVPAAFTGRLFVPPAWRVARGTAVPLVVYAHGTELRKEAVPSRFGGQEWAVGAAAAAWYGFPVAMPDLPGMGGDAGAYHPYCHARSLAYAVVDCVPAALAALRAQGRLDWDGRLFLVGYSEGGYAALAAVKELETHRGAYAAAGIRLTGSACMAGPFDLSGAMRAAFIEKVRRYSRAYYLPYIVRGYHAVYGPRLDPREVLAPALLAEGADGGLLAWTDGSRDGEAVDAALGARLGMEPEAISLRALFDPAWLERELDDPAYATSATRALLAENDLWGGWTPTRPILFRHSPDDANVPYDNSRVARERLAQAARAAGTDPDRFLHLVPVGRDGDGISHPAAAWIALPSAFGWFRDGMPVPGPAMEADAWDRQPAGS